MSPKFLFFGCNNLSWCCVVLCCVVFQLDGENASEEEYEMGDEEGRGGEGREVCVKKAFHKSQDHRPSFQDMHSEDRKRRPRYQLFDSNTGLYVYF